MADNTQGKAQQKDPGAGSNPQAQAKAAPAPAPARREAARTPVVSPDVEMRSDPNPGTRLDKRPTAEEIAKRDPKTYRAMDRGYVDGRIVEPGEVFVTKADKGEWMEPVKGGSTKYTGEQAVDEAQYAKKLDVDYEGMSEAGLEALAALVGVSKPGDLKKAELIEAIRAARRVDAQ